jgi:hypothetical protein
MTYRGRNAPCRLGRGVVGGSITRGIARDFQFCTAKLVVQRSGSGATFVGAVTGLDAGNGTASGDSGLKAGHDRVCFRGDPRV